MIAHQCHRSLRGDAFGWYSPLIFGNGCRNFCDEDILNTHFDTRLSAFPVGNLPTVAGFLPVFRVQTVAHFGPVFSLKEAQQKASAALVRIARFETFKPQILHPAHRGKPPRYGDGFLLFTSGENYEHLSDFSGQYSA
ncbi:hypothetical protein CRQ31_05685 [Salmonella enterica subsp. enterica serovar Worthington]|uniref:Uncharacterized protein n=1 Tax=Salmonella enterica subsp. enterica serovar Ank TaxID=1173578 RepID=A0A5I2X8F6_SALET|nr:hypothetical protein [Salmonella enterica subsp. enterica serovar Denver]ECF3886805.1 hypothetical protein [Salmonella enterica subsp. enterica serovar Ank]EGI5051739.1 hypothetical protein [Salmonella enterica subsp. enterica serovar Worthington]HAE1791693.1 hypothetical protein [Salmonella enterica subsp. enterica serovar Ank]